MIIAMKGPKLHSIMDATEIVITDDTIFIVVFDHKVVIRHNMNKDDLLGLILKNKAILSVDDSDGGHNLIEVMKCVRIDTRKADSEKGN